MYEKTAERWSLSPQEVELIIELVDSRQWDVIELIEEGSLDSLSDGH